MGKNITKDIRFEEQCIVDIAKIFYYEGRILRAIYDDQQAQLYKKILSEGTLEKAFDEGLVKTWIADDIEIDNCNLIVEHERIDFFLHPAEMTNEMFWKCAMAYLKICIVLNKNHLGLKDAHPWNITFHFGKPVFFDFSSLVQNGNYNNYWMDEFFLCIAVPIKLANTKWDHLSNEYRRQHRKGFGLSMANLSITKKIFFRSFFKIFKHSENYLILSNLLEWVESKPPKRNTGEWDTYDQCHDTSYNNPVTPKQKFVYTILKTENPINVVDLAANKGYFSLMAEELKAKVIAFDYESNSVDEGIRKCIGKNITFCQMDFTYPTPNYGWGLIGPDAFTRFKSDIVLALGLIHHVCLRQNFPVKLFCETCIRFSTKGVLLEFVFPDDIHVKKWNLPIPDDYSIDSLIEYFGYHFDSYKFSELFEENMLKRQFIYFYSSNKV